MYIGREYMWLIHQQDGNEATVIKYLEIQEY